MILFDSFKYLGVVSNPYFEFSRYRPVFIMYLTMELQTRSQYKVTIALLDIFSQNENNEDNNNHQIKKQHKLELWA